MAEPLRLLSQDADGKFILGEEALSALSSVKGPVGVVAVCGRARQGKSFILNQLLGRSNGFKVAPTIRPVTKGLWMWSAPVERTLPDGSKYHLVRLISIPLPTAVCFPCAAAEARARAGPARYRRHRRVRPDGAV